MLSKVCPVGIMVFGNAEFMRYPWETIVKMYRSQNGAKSHQTIQQWGADFVSYVSRFGNIDEHEREMNVESVVDSVFMELLGDVLAKAMAGRISHNSDEFKQLLKDHLEVLTENIDQKPFFSNVYMSSFKVLYGDAIDGIVNKYLGGVNDKSIKALADEYIYKFITHSSFSPFSSGVVIAGFGDADIFPALVHYETDGYLGKNNKLKLESSVIITRDNSSCIMPFAQHEMVQRFMDGIDPTYSEFLHTGVHKIMTESCLSVLEKYGTDEHKNNSKVKDAIVSAVSKSLNTRNAECHRFQQKYYSSPIINMVSLLPKDELPNLVESLVALTSLKRHVSHDEETVGGPIDVALISKSDGFIWINRKHYFKTELNPQFARNYGRDIEQGGENVRPKRIAAKPKRGKTKP